MENLLTFIIKEDENNKKMHLTIFVDKDRNVTALNLAGTVLEEELKSIETPKVPLELYEYMKKGKPIDLTEQFKSMSTEEIKTYFLNKLKG